MGVSCTVPSFVGGCTPGTQLEPVEGRPSGSAITVPTSLESVGERH